MSEPKSSEAKPRAHGLTSQEIERRCREMRAAQGLPPGIEDGPTLDRLVMLIRGPMDGAP